MDTNLGRVTEGLKQKQIDLAEKQKQLLERENQYKEQVVAIDLGPNQEDVQPESAGLKSYEIDKNVEQNPIAEESTPDETPGEDATEEEDEFVLQEVFPPFLPKKNLIDSPYTLVLDLDETSIHFVNT